MPSWLYGAACGYVLVALVPGVWLTRRLSKGKNALLGVLPAFVASLVAYATLLTASLLFGFVKGLWLFLIAEALPLVLTFFYAALRAKRYRALSEQYKENRRTARPAIVTSMKMRRALKGFSIASPLPVEAQHEIVILLKNHTDPKVITSFYHCRESDLVKIERAFDEHLEKTAPKPVKKGEPYTVEAHQREFLMRLMMTSTPSGLSCKDSLLWDEDSVAALIHKSSGKYPTRDSVLRFLDECGILLTEAHYALYDTPEGKLWEKTQYEKIRMSALEREATVVWVYALHAKGMPYTVLSAVTPDTPPMFGVYKENSGLSDFLSKLPSGKTYAVLCLKLSDFKKFTSPPPNITIFPYGERRDIPDT